MQRFNIAQPPPTLQYISTTDFSSVNSFPTDDGSVVSVVDCVTIEDCSYSLSPIQPLIRTILIINTVINPRFFSILFNSGHIIHYTYKF